MKITDWFIDADTHITEPGDVWTSRLPARFRDRAPRIVRNDAGLDTWQFGRTAQPIPSRAGRSRSRLAHATWTSARPIPTTPRRAWPTWPSIVAQSMGVLLQHAIQMLDVAMSGILPRTPRPRIVSVESGVGWIPFVREALDHGFEYAKVSNEKPEFRKKPSEYLRKQVWACTFFEEFAPQKLADVIGVDRILFETDYPHPICLYGNVREKIDAALSAHPEELRRKILFDNAAALYGLGQPDRPTALQRGT